MTQGVPVRAPSLLLLLTLLGCKPFEEIGDRPCPPGGTALTYGNFGAAFLGAHCQSCHGSQATDRRGAPGDFIFDSPDQARRHAARIFVRSAAGNTSMPPGPEDPPAAARDQLAEWLRCGAP